MEPELVKKNLQIALKKEYLRLKFNSEGEKIRSGATVVTMLINTFITLLFKIDEKSNS
jgi:hypothetical protein